MPTVHDVAEYIAVRVPDARRDWWRLQKLVFYSQAWSLAWDGVPLFNEPIEAWKDGPVVNELYSAQKYGPKVPGDASRLDASARQTVDAVVRAYGDRPGTWLSELTHREGPWRQARGALPPTAWGREVISLDAMKRWYAAQGQPAKVISEPYLRGLEILVETPEEEVPRLLDGAAGAMQAESYLQWLEKGDQWPDSQE